jgi:hypothetical protein
MDDVADDLDIDLIKEICCVCLDTNDTLKNIPCCNGLYLCDTCIIKLNNKCPVCKKSTLPNNENAVASEVRILINPNRVRNNPVLSVNNDIDIIESSCHSKVMILSFSCLIVLQYVATILLMNDIYNCIINAYFLPIQFNIIRKLSKNQNIINKNNHYIDNWSSIMYISKYISDLIYILNLGINTNIEHVDIYVVCFISIAYTWLLHNWYGDSDATRRLTNQILQIQTINIIYIVSTILSFKMLNNVSTNIYWYCVSILYFLSTFITSIKSEEGFLFTFKYVYPEDITNEIVDTTYLNILLNKTDDLEGLFNHYFCNLSTKLIYYFTTMLISVFYIFNYSNDWMISKYNNMITGAFILLLFVYFTIITIGGIFMMIYLVGNMVKYASKCTIGYATILGICLWGSSG